MTVFVALLRAVNVGGTGKLPMTELKAICEAAGFERVRTYIASGNVVFDSGSSEAQVKAALEQRLQAYAGKPIAVMVRTAAELAAVLECNPFPNCNPSRVLITFLDTPPVPEALQTVKHQRSEQLFLGKREIYVNYGDGIGTSKLVVPAAKAGTARNVNTVRKLLALACV